jgi:hypothetical protein
MLLSVNTKCGQEIHVELKDYDPGPLSPTLTDSLNQMAENNIKFDVNQLTQIEYEFDTEKPYTTVFVRLLDGTKMELRLNMTDKVETLYRFAEAVTVGDNKQFILHTQYPTRELLDKNQTIEDANVDNDVLVQRLCAY